MKSMCYMVPILMLLSVNKIIAQNVSTAFDHTIANFQQQAINNPIEKAYLQLDRSYYAAGDTIWFKAYVVTGSMHQLSGISNVLNVELVNDRDSIRKNLKLYMENGLCHGGVALPDSIKEGNYRVRAYTGWMRNWGEEYYFDKNIHVINAIVNTAPNKKISTIAVKTNQPAISKTDIQFFPEGGNLVSGIDCKVAFKAVNPYGAGIPIKGIVVDEQDNTVAELNSGTLGMGTFTLNAEAGKLYKAKIVAGNGPESIVELPKSISNGYALSICEAGKEHIRIIAMGGAGISQTGEMKLVAQANGTIYYVGSSKAGSNSFMATIPKNKFPTGIVQFTLFSTTGEPLNERLMFIQNNDQLKLNIMSAKQAYAPQEKVMLKLVATNNLKPVQGSFSVSVVDESKVPGGDTTENTILSNLLLTSDLKGYVENPGYYFSSANEQARADLDALMLTQGYRRFTRQHSINNEKLQTIYPADTALSITGKLTTSNKKPVAVGRVTLYSMGGGFFEQDTLTDNAGRFAFKNLAFNEHTNFVVQSAEKERDRYRISIDMDKPVAIPNKNIAEFALNNEIDILPFIQNSKQLYQEELRYDYNGKARLLKEVVIKETSQKNLASPNSILKSGRHADYVVTGKQIMAVSSARVSLTLFGLIPHLVYDANGLLKRTADPRTPPMAVLLDGFLINNIDQVSPRNIESIEVVSNTLIVTTKRGITDDDMSYTESLPGYKKFTPTGFYKVREFYSPQYDNPKTNIPVANLRSTIFWKPNIETDKDGVATFEYFNAGNKGTYKVVVEGIDYATGNLGHQVYKYTVE